MNYKKKFKLGIGIPSPKTVEPEFSLRSLPDLIEYTKTTFPNVKIITEFQTGVRTDKNRNTILDKLMTDEVDWILWLDADMIYPPNIVEQYLLANEINPVDAIGCLYFKRSYPYSPICYKKNEGENKSTHPYTEIPPNFISRDTIYEVDGIGFGGMMVNSKVYKKLGKNGYHNYGKNFHYPFPNEHALTHDLQFCKVLKANGYSIKVHGGVRPGHIGKIIIDENDYKPNITLTRYPKVAVMMPHINLELAEKCGKILEARAGMPFDLKLIEDTKRQGFVKTVNEFVDKNKDYELYVYTAQDVFVSKGWLLEAVIEQAIKGAGVVAFNDGKWHGRMAQFGMVSRKFIDEQGGYLFNPIYQANYCDVELSQLAKQKGVYTWAEKAIMIEVDYVKDFGGKTNPNDKKLYNERKKTQFDGKITNQELIEEFS